MASYNEEQLSRTFRDENGTLIVNDLILMETIQNGNPALFPNQNYEEYNEFEWKQIAEKINFAYNSYSSDNFPFNGVHYHSRWKQICKLLPKLLKKLANDKDAFPESIQEKLKFFAEIGDRTAPQSPQMQGEYTKSALVDMIQNNAFWIKKLEPLELRQLESEILQIILDNEITNDKKPIPKQAVEEECENFLKSISFYESDPDLPPTTSMEDDNVTDIVIKDEIEIIEQNFPTDDMTAEEKEESLLEEIFSEVYSQEEDSNEDFGQRLIQISPDLDKKYTQRCVVRLQRMDLKD